MTDQVQILLHDEVQLMDWGESRSAGPWIKIRLGSSDDLQPFKSLDVSKGNKTGHILNATIAKGDIAKLAQEQEEQKKEGERKYGQHARALMLSGFFKEPAVYMQVGKDRDFLQWLKSQRCVVTGAETVDVAHVREIAAGAGVGIKPEYSAIPLSRQMHRHVQHQQGIVYLYRVAHGKSTNLTWSDEDIKIARRWLQDKVRRHIVGWAWETLRKQLGYESWSEVPPEKLRAWAHHHDVTELLPDEYQ